MYKTPKFIVLPVYEFSAAFYRNWSYAFCFQNYFQKHSQESSILHFFPWKRKSLYMLIIFSGNQILSLFLVRSLCKHNCRILSPFCSLWDRELWCQASSDAQAPVMVGKERYREKWMTLEHWHKLPKPIVDNFLLLTRKKSFLMLSFKPSHNELKFWQSILLRQLI